MPSLSQLKQLIFQTYTEWNQDQAPRLGAALAYYTCLSLAPLLILVIAVAGLIFGKDAATGQLYGQIQDMVGADGAKAIQEMIRNASKPASGILATVIGFLTLVFGASSVATELRNALNVLWDRPYDADAGVKDMIKERSYALVVVLSCGFLLVVSLVASSAVAAAGKYVSGFLPVSAPLLQLLNFALSFLVLTGVFAVLFKYLPDIDVQWHDVLLGAAFTSLLFGVGKLLIGLYLGTASFGSTYGAAGSLVILLVWIYYSAQIFFFGAEFTQVYARRHGSDPNRHAGDRVLVTPSPAVAAYARRAAQGNSGLPVTKGNAVERAGSIAGSFASWGRKVKAIWKP